MTPRELNHFIKSSDELSDRHLALLVFQKIQLGIEARNARLNHLIDTLAGFVEEKGRNTPEELEPAVSMMIPKIINIIECQIENESSLVKVFETLAKASHTVTKKSPEPSVKTNSESTGESVDDTTTPVYKDHTSITFGDDGPTQTP
jgi:CRISPR/Cas system CSM-associated protein Csm2 small subunit